MATCVQLVQCTTDKACLTCPNDLLKVALPVGLHARTETLQVFCGDMTDPQIPPYMRKFVEYTGKKLACISF